MAGSPLLQAHDFQLGPIRVRPAARSIEGDRGSFVTEPLVMQLLVELSRKAGRVVTRREIFDRCWGSAAVGDDSLNRIVRALRKTLDLADGNTVQIETVPGAGYSLRLRAPAGLSRDSRRSEVENALREALETILHGLPEPGNLALEMLRRALFLDPSNAAAWGMHALLNRYAAEYAEPSDVAGFVADCRASARRAIDLEPNEPYAKVALATVAPLFGRWSEARSSLIAVLEQSPDEFVAHHELVIADMATGRVKAALERTNRLIAADPLAACMIYKGIYQRWSAGDLIGMDQLAESGIQLWPTHPAIWTARLWTLAYTNRLDAALDMIEDEPGRPAVPAPMLRLLTVTIGAAAQQSRDAIELASSLAREAAANGPARAISALFALGLLGDVDSGFSVAEGYYLRSGSGPVPVRRTSGEPSINDQHRRVTQILFTPACALMRADPRFMNLCERAGLRAYWEQSGLVPDFLASR